MELVSIAVIVGGALALVYLFQRGLVFGNIWLGLGIFAWLAFLWFTGKRSY